jgi:hypothetical protein
LGGTGGRHGPKWPCLHHGRTTLGCPTKTIQATFFIFIFIFYALFALFGLFILNEWSIKNVLHPIQ